MASTNEQANAFNAIINSITFSHASKYKDLLKFLFEEYENGQHPKEIDIAQHVFQRDKSFNPTEDTIVRVSMHKLRKKLDNYYQDEGKCESLRLKIPKGHYNLLFQTADKKRTDNSSVHKRPKYLWLGICFSLIIIIVILTTAYFNIKSQWNQVTPIQKNNAIWKEFIDTDTPTLLTMGTLFFYQYTDPISNRQLMIRDVQINSTDEFNAMLNSENQSISEYDPHSPNPYFDRSNVWPILSILPLLHNHQVHTMLRQSRFINPDEIHQNNIIFLGNIKTHGVFKHFMDQTSFKFGINPPFVQYITDQQDTIKLTPDIKLTSFHEDYGMVTKIPGPSENFIMIFTDFDASANSGAARFFTSKKSLDRLIKLFKDKYGKMPKYFEVLFKTKGLNRTEISTEIVHFKKLDL